MINPAHFGRSAPFFLLQPLGIAMEGIVVTVVQKSHIPVTPIISKLVGYCWVCLWLTLTVPLFIDVLLDEGVYSVAQFSPTRLLLDYLHISISRM